MNVNLLTLQYVITLQEKKTALFWIIIVRVVVISNILDPWR